MPKNLGVDTFPDPVRHFGAPWRPLWILQAGIIHPHHYIADTITIIKDLKLILHLHIKKNNLNGIVET